MSGVAVRFVSDGHSPLFIESRAALAPAEVRGAVEMVSFHATGSSKRLAWRLRRTFHSISRKRHKYWGEREASGKPPENSLQTICRLMDGGLATDHADKEMGAVTEPAARKVVLEVDGVQWATQGNVMEAVVGLQPGVIGVEANPVAQTATVTYDPARTSVPELELNRPGVSGGPVWWLSRLV